MFFEVSSDGVTWTEIAEKSTPSFTTDAYLDLYGGVDTVQTGNLGTATFDNLFDCIH